MADKLLYTMGEVAEMFDVKPSLIRHWESQFDQIRPTRNNKGNRLFSPNDIEKLKLIYHLVRERGMTLDGARQALRAERVGGNQAGESATIYERDTQIAERLQKLRSKLVELRSLVDQPQETPTPTPTSRRRPKSDEPEIKNGELFAFYEQRLF